MRVALVCMPFQNFALPSLGLGLIQAALRLERIDCDVHYLNLRFASRIGCLSYLKLGVESPTDSLAGEWLFAGDLFGENPESEQSYVESILTHDSEGYFRGARLRRLLDVRRGISRFLDECVESVSWREYDLIGFASTFQQNVASLALAKRMKASFPNNKIVFGGANCEGEMGIELHRHFPFVDFVCSGEGDRAFPELLRHLIAGKDTTQIAGIISRVGGETVVPPRIISPIFDLDALPFPNYDDYFVQLENTRLNRRFAPIVPCETSRGCWWGAKMHCTFCGLNGATMAYRVKSPQRAFDELLYLGRRYGTKIHCADNIIDLKYLDSFFPKLAHAKLRLRIQCETKVNLTRKQLQGLQSAGVRKLQPGIESLSTPVLRLMKKGCNLLQVVQFLKWCKQLGIEVIWNVLYGFPGETPGDYAEMARIVPLLSHLAPPIDMGRIRLDRFSPYFARPADYGFRNLRPRAAYTHVYPFPKEVLTRLAYSFDADHAELTSVEGYVRPLAKEVKRWQSGRRGCLTGKLVKAGLAIVDTRRGKRESVTILEEPFRSAYIFCDQARPFSAILCHLTARFPEQRLTDCFLERGVDDLVARGLMLKEGKSYLSLAVLSNCDEALNLESDFALREPRTHVQALVQVASSPHQPAS